MSSLVEATEVDGSERERLERLFGYSITKRYEKVGAFQHIVSMAAHAFGVPVAVVNFVDQEKVLTRSAVGYENLSEVDRRVSICSLAILSDQVTVFEDARQDPCLIGNPFVYGEFGLQFYAAAPLRTHDGFNIGVVAVADRKPRRFTEADVKLLEALAAMVMEELEEGKS
ncbi:GAF domain-containing protein [Pontibacter sp. 13R65]|uniref:GAF domain-containing protein n=1 Tax=Pontibacter sp. 13R65 TaxID=3127458 RepID=UPI00301D98FC